MFQCARRLLGRNFQTVVVRHQYAPGSSDLLSDVDNHAGSIQQTDLRSARMLKKALVLSETAGKSTYLMYLPVSNTANWSTPSCQTYIPNPGQDVKGIEGEQSSLHAVPLGGTLPELKYSRTMRRVHSLEEVRSAQ